MFWTSVYLNKETWGEIVSLRDYMFFLSLSVLCMRSERNSGFPTSICNMEKEQEASVSHNSSHARLEHSYV